MIIRDFSLFLSVPSRTTEYIRTVRADILRLIIFLPETNFVRLGMSGHLSGCIRLEIFKNLCDWMDWHRGFFVSVGILQNQAEADSSYWSMVIYPSKVDGKLFRNKVYPLRTRRTKLKSSEIPIYKTENSLFSIFVACHVQQKFENSLKSKV